MKIFFFSALIIIFSLISGALGSYAMNIFLQNSENTFVERTTVTNLENLETTITNTVEEIAPSVVSIVIRRDIAIYRSDPWGFFQRQTGTVSRQVGGGSGFFVRADGTIMTNKHVVQDEESEYTVILNTGEEYDAEVIATDPVNDIAIIKIDDATRDFPVLSLIEDTESVNVGEFSIAVGNALAEFQNSVSLGIISGKGRTIEAQGESLSGLLQTDAAINPGNSGGPLINLSGQVIGINTAIASNSNNIGFAFALNQERVDYILESIENSGRIMRPFIGINYIPNSPGVARELGLSVDYGVYIIDESESIVSGSSAEVAGLEPGDVILEADGQRLSGRNSLGSIIQNSLPGETLELRVLKPNAREVSVDLELGAM